MAARIVGIAIGALLCAGCTVGPDFKRPAPATPAAYINPSATPAPTNSVTVAAPVDAARWWTHFNDPELDRLVARAVDGNLDLRQAQARLREARALRGVVGSQLLPSADAVANYTRSGAGSGNIHSYVDKFGKTHTHNDAIRQDFYQAGFDATWELDLFGGIRRNIESADASARAALSQRNAVLVSLIAETAADYITLRGYQRQLAIARENLGAQQRTAEVTRKKLGAGFVSRLDVANADEQVFSTRADIPAIESSERQTIYALSVLVGREPGALLAELSTPGAIPPAPPRVPIGLPLELLRRRPDVLAAEENLHSATANVGVATAELFPKINLVGSLDVDAAKIRGLGNWANNVWSFGPSISWPIFAGGRIVANIEVNNALQEQALIAYNQSVLAALQDVENALVAYAREQDRRDALVQEVDAARDAVNLSNRLYDQGQTDFLNVLNAERTLFAAETSLVDSQTRVAIDLTALYKALGGGWDAAPSAAGSQTAAAR